MRGFLQEGVSQAYRPVNAYLLLQPASTFSPLSHIHTCACAYIHTHTHIRTHAHTQCAHAAVELHRQALASPTVLCAGGHAVRGGVAQVREEPKDHHRASHLQHYPHLDPPALSAVGPLLGVYVPSRLNVGSTVGEMGSWLGPMTPMIYLLLAIFIYWLNIPSRAVTILGHCEMGPWLLMAPSFKTLFYSSAWHIMHDDQHKPGQPGQPSRCLSWQAPCMTMCRDSYPKINADCNTGYHHALPLPIVAILVARYEPGNYQLIRVSEFMLIL